MNIRTTEHPNYRTLSLPPPPRLCASAVRCFSLVLAILVVPVSLQAETLVVDGGMRARIALEVRAVYRGAMSQLRVETPVPRSFTSATVRQQVDSVRWSFSPDPTRAESRTNRFGSEIRILTWEKPPATVEIVRTATIETQVEIGNLTSSAPFPPASPPPEARLFLAGTLLVQRDDPQIVSLARRLTAGVTGQADAASRILRFVVDHLRYQPDPGQHDARFVLDRGIANCQGYSHLALALLRSAGLPARLVGGISLDQAWRVPLGRDVLVQKMGKGWHAWIEVYYADVGWLAYDPQTSERFVSPYHVRQAIGLDVEDITDRSWYIGTLPTVSEAITHRIEGEQGGLQTREILRDPRAFFVAARLTAVAPGATPGRLEVIPEGTSLPPGPPAAPMPGLTPAPQAASTPSPPHPVGRPVPLLPDRLAFTQITEFGNLEFPAALKILRQVEVLPGGGRVGRTFLVETAEYVTGRAGFAQAFDLDRPLLVNQVSLALQKFGGRSGEVWVQITRDAAGEPGAPVAESRRIPVAGLVPFGGYRWVVFDLGGASGGLVLPPGRYWVAPRHTGDPILNWYFSLGTSGGRPGDARSRPDGAPRWSHVLNYRFNFRVSGLATP